MPEQETTQTETTTETTQATEETVEFEIVEVAPDGGGDERQRTADGDGETTSPGTPGTITLTVAEFEERLEAARVEGAEAVQGAAVEGAVDAINGKAETNNGGD